MRLLRRALALATLTALAAAAGAAQESWESAMQAAVAAASSGDFQRAELALQQAIDIANGLAPGDPRLEASLETLGRLYEDQGRLDKAQPTYELLIAAREYRAGPSSPELLNALSAAGRVALRAGDVPAAAAHLRRYVELADATGKAEPAELWQVLGLLARMGTLEHSPEDALLFQRQALAVMDKDPASSPEERAAVAGSLAALELDHGSPAAAESLLARAAELERQSGRPEAAVATLAKGAAQALSAGELDLSDRLVERVLTLEPGPDIAIAARKSLAESAWRRLPRTGSLDSWLRSPADTPLLTAAATRLQALYKVQRLTLAPDDPGLLETLTRQVAVAAMRGDLATAEQAQQQLVEAKRTGDGPPLADALADLVTIQLAAGRTAAAAANNQGLIEVMSFHYGAGDPRVRPVLERQLALLGQLGRTHDAKLVKKRLRRDY